MAGLEDNVVVLVGNAVEGNNISGEEFFHDVLGAQFSGIEFCQLFVIADLPGGIGADTVVRFYDNRIADFLNELLAFFQSGRQMISGDRNTGSFIVGLHV